MLERFPFVAAASAEPEIGCAIHCGITDGMESDERVEKLVA